MEYERGRKDGLPSNVGPKQTFTGHVMQDTLIDDGDKGEIRVYSVIFEPGARTYWHSHAAGQTLLVNSGQGMVEEHDDNGDRPQTLDVEAAPPRRRAGRRRIGRRGDCCGHLDYPGVLFDLQLRRADEHPDLSSAICVGRESNLCMR